MNTTLILLVLLGICLFLLLSMAGILLLSGYLRYKSVREYDELHSQFKKEIGRAEDSAEELAEDIGDVANFTISYSLFRKARGKERKRQAELEMAVWWDKLPREIQVAFSKLGKEVGLKPTETPS